MRRRGADEGGVCLLFGVGRLARAVVKEEELSLEEWEALELLVELRERHLTCATREKHVAQAEAHQGRYRVGWRHVAKGGMERRHVWPMAEWRVEASKSAGNAHLALGHATQHVAQPLAHG